MRARTIITALTGAALGAATLVAATTTAAGADTQTIEIVIDSGDIQPGRNVVWAPEGTTVSLATVNVPADLVGRECEGAYVDANNGSLHPGNDIVVSTGSTSVRFPGVEDSVGAVRTASGDVVLGSTIAVDLIMGPDEIFSADAAVAITCEDPPPPATTEAPTTTEAPPATTEAPASTVAPATTQAPATTSTVPTQVGGVQEANPAEAVDAVPSFTG